MPQGHRLRARLLHARRPLSQRPLEPVFGREGIRAVLEPFLANAEEVDWVIHNAVSNGTDMVMNERTDRFLMPVGWVELPVMGVFEIRDGKIAGWRDYFDMAPMRPVLGGE
ncbi:MAG: limonene-1,2-epoxide hydrolase family protein [Novosphingobium sp.]|nr:limonene-1,2-epoxide hydrolase family protein [Novosphingobium sp.]